MHINSLTDIRVLVTRPKHQAVALCQMLEEHGALAVCLPVIEIEAMALSQKMASLMDDIQCIHFAIFISPNAVEHGLATLLAHGEIPDTLKLVTIGKASAQKMQQLLGRAPDIYPIEQYNSEALLALDHLQAEQVNHKNIIIFRGEGGREHLATSLKNRGAKVDYIEVYRRKLPKPKKSVLESLWKENTSPDIVTATSNEGLSNLVAMLAHFGAVEDNFYLQKLFQTPLVVVTEKMRSSAQTLGFKNIIMIAARASNEALLESVLEWSKIRL